MFTSDVRKELRNIRSALEKYNKALKPGGYYPNNLCGLCAIGASLTHHRLRNKLNMRLAYNYRHVFNIVKLKGREVVLDLTATQFGLKKCVILPLEEAIKRDYYHGYTVKYNIDDLDFDLRYWDKERPINYRKVKRYLDKTGVKNEA